MLSSGMDPIASSAAAAAAAAAATGTKEREEEEEEEGNDWDRTMVMLWCVTIVVVVVVMIVLGVLFYQQQNSEQHYQHLTSKEKDRHYQLVQRAINNTQGSGLPWYEATDVPKSCLVETIVRWEIDHGLRPPPGEQLY